LWANRTISAGWASGALRTGITLRTLQSNNTGELAAIADKFGRAQRAIGCDVGNSTAIATKLNDWAAAIVMEDTRQSIGAVSLAKNTNTVASAVDRLTENADAKRSKVCTLNAE
jgi:hypothetical protein